MKKRAALFLFSCFLLATASAQTCGFEERNKSWMASPDYANFQQELAAKEKEIAGDKSETVFIVPVVFHVIARNSAPSTNISAAQVFSQLRVLNEDFRKRNADTATVDAEFSVADVAIEFCLAKRDPDGNMSTGIERYSTDQKDICTGSNYKTVAPIWNPKEYLNIWVCEYGEILGSAPLPNNDPTDDDEDGVLINYKSFGTIGTAEAPYDGGRTATHEVGHWFNLLHIWGINQSCANDDGITDTPNQEAIVSDCPSTNFSCGSKDMLSNFMGYIDDDCMGNFTEGQKGKMRTAAVNARTSLLLSKGCMVVGLEEQQWLNSIVISPNPSNGQLNLRLPSQLLGKEISIEVYNALGQRQEFQTNQIFNGYEIDMKNPLDGIYFVKLSQEKGFVLKKWIIRK